MTSWPRLDELPSESKDVQCHLFHEVAEVGLDPGRVGWDAHPLGFPCVDTRSRPGLFLESGPPFLETSTSVSPLVTTE